MTPERLLAEVDRFCAAGACRELDRAFVRLLADRAGGADAAALLGALLASTHLVHGHICVDLSEVLAAPQERLPLPSTPAEALLATLTVSTWTTSLLTVLADPGEGCRPLVVDGGRLYLRRYWQYETQLAEALNVRAARSYPLPADLHERLDQFFGPLRDADERAGEVVHWQTVAAAVTATFGLLVVSGGPGTGKTTTVVGLLALLQDLALQQGSPLRIRLAAPTGKAAARLGESIGAAVAALPKVVAAALPREVSTVHRLLGGQPGSRRFRFRRSHPLPTDLLVIDEASMVDLELMTAVVDALRPDARLILLGDRDQLASVEAGAILAELCRDADAGSSLAAAERIEAQTGYRIPSTETPGALADNIVVLRRSHRFAADSGIAQLAQAVNRGDVAAATAMLQAGEGNLERITPRANDSAGLARFVAGRQAMAGYRNYFDALSALAVPPDDAAAFVLLELFNRLRVLCAVRVGPFGVTAMNSAIASHLWSARLIDAATGWYVGRPVMVTRNDYSLGLMNGDVGITVRDASGVLRVLFQTAGPDGPLIRRVLPSRLVHIETVYAMTVHKSQGSEFDHTVLALPPVDSPVVTRELLYTAITRARQRFTLAVPAPEVFERAIGRRTLRASGLADALQRHTGRDDC